MILKKEMRTSTPVPRTSPRMKTTSDLMGV
jgi:hypothetical protein